MATPLKRLGVQALNCSIRIPQRQRVCQRTVWRRTLSSSVRQNAGDKKPPKDEDWIDEQLSVKDFEADLDDATYTEVERQAAKASAAVREGKEAENAARAEEPVQALKKQSREPGPSNTVEERQSTPVQSQKASDADYIDEPPKATGFLQKILGVNPFRKPTAPKQLEGQVGVNERGWPVDKDGWPLNPLDNDEGSKPYDPQDEFKYGEFGDDFEHITPEEPEEQKEAYATAVRSLKEAMDRNAPDAEITNLLRNVQETQKALAAANVEWANEFNTALTEEINDQWEEAIAQRQEGWDAHMEDLKAMEKDMLTRDPDDPGGFWSMGQENEGVGDDEEFHNDDLTPLGHAELEQHREIREYARLAAWEMPLLSKLAKPFTPPTASTPLRFRYTTYMGEQHPAGRKVVVDFSPSDIPSLNSTQKAKLIKIAGVRYNPSTDRIKMSCENFEHATQNKRYLADLVDSLVDEAKKGDMFQDVPFDFRHHRPRPRYEFPEGWKMTEERRAQLEAKRLEKAQREKVLLGENRVMHGMKVIEEALRVMPQVERLPEMVAVGADRKGGAPRRIVR